MLIKRQAANARRSKLAPAMGKSETLDRRSFLRRSGLTATGLGALGTLSFGSVQQVQAATGGPKPDVPVVVKTNI